MHAFNNTVDSMPVAMPVSCLRAALDKLRCSVATEIAREYHLHRATMSSNNNSNNPSAHIDSENATRAPRNRRGSLTCAWDCGEDDSNNDLVGTLSSDTGNNDKDNNNGVIHAADGIGMGAGRLAPPPITDPV